MYAVIKTGGKQYRVQAGDLLVVEKLEGEPGANVAFGDVLMLGDGETITLGAPIVEGASVSATLIETRKGLKVKIFKKRRRQGYRRTRGHRQHESVLRVTSVAGAGKTENWDGVVDMTTKAVLNARARNLKLEEAATAKAALAGEKAAAKPAPAKKVAAPKAAAPKAEAAAKKPAAPKKAAAKKPDAE
ncbi:MAG: 50S ribosomal protein L21 [Pseudomonadota bacterium]